MSRFVRNSSSNSSTNDGKIMGYVLVCILIALVILAFRPFGFRTFLHGLEHDNIFSLLLLVSIVAICLVIVQRAGIIFADTL
ncbi:MAG TPA: hypothetical protein VH796_03320 [Nitrososphaeraceae archaeon]|jgi:hypothetical protein